MRINMCLKYVCLKWLLGTYVGRKVGMYVHVWNKRHVWVMMLHLCVPLSISHTGLAFLLRERETESKRMNEVLSKLLWGLKFVKEACNALHRDLRFTSIWASFSFCFLPIQSKVESFYILSFTNEVSEAHSLT